jgi:hypothetical protein
MTPGLPLSAELPVPVPVPELVEAEVVEEQLRLQAPADSSY